MPEGLLSCVGSHACLRAYFLVSVMTDTRNGMFKGSRSESAAARRVAADLMNQNG